MKYVPEENVAFVNCRVRFVNWLLAFVICFICYRQAASAASQAATPDSPSSAVKRVITLKQEARTLESQERTRTEAILKEIISLDDANALPDTRDVGRALVDIASRLVSTRDYDRLERIFSRGIEILQNSTGTTIGDVIVGLNNLSAMYDQQGNSRARDRVNSNILNFLADYTGPLDSDAVEVFLSLGDIYDRAGHPKAVAILYRQIQRYMQQTDFPAETRILVAHRYANALAGDQQYDEAMEVWVQAFNLKDDRTPVSNKGLLESFALSQGPDKLLDVLSDIATVYFKAGRFEQASEIYWRAFATRAEAFAEGSNRGIAPSRH